MRVNNDKDLSVYDVFGPRRSVPVDPARAKPRATKEAKRYWLVAVDAPGQEGLPSASVRHYRQFRTAYLPFVGEWHQ